VQALTNEDPNRAPHPDPPEEERRETHEREVTAEKAHGLRQVSGLLHCGRKLDRVRNERVLVSSFDRRPITEIRHDQVRGISCEASESDHVRCGQVAGAHPDAGADRRL